MRSTLKIMSKGLFSIPMILMMGCTPSYLCPLKNLPGACSSQQTAYQATLTHEPGKDSIFENSGHNKESVVYDF